MAAISLAKHAVSALNREKPHSSITDLVEILTAPGYDDEAFDGIPELVQSINLQPTGPAEASRAIRKKLKHGDAHRQYRALVLLKAMVENGGTKFQRTFADEQLTDAIKHLAQDANTDQKVKKKLYGVLTAWHRQFEGDPSMSLVSNLYRSMPSSQQQKSPSTQRTGNSEAIEAVREYERRKREEKETREEAKEESKRKAKQLKQEEKRKRETEVKRKLDEKTRRRFPFDFEKEKSQVYSAIAEASQAATNLINALTLVNTEHDSVKENIRVQDCLEICKQVRKRIVRYIQLVENEDVIGTLLETNERIITALETFDKLSAPDITTKDVEEVQAGLAAVNITGSEVSKLQEKQRAAVERSINRARERERERDDIIISPTTSKLHPDLRDLSFGSLGTEQRYLQEPIRPSSRDSDDHSSYDRGSLSDFSDHDSSDEETHAQHTTASSSYRPYNTAPSKPLAAQAAEDPFADPFAD